MEKNEYLKEERTEKGKEDGIEKNRKGKGVCEREHDRSETDARREIRKEKNKYVKEEKMKKEKEEGREER